MFSSFKGGIHPPENKKISEKSQFANLSIPQVSYIPMQQHIGAPAKPVVEVGDQIEEGQLIGESSGFISANVHSSVPGKVIEISDITTIYGKQQTVVIEAEGEFSSSGNQNDSQAWAEQTNDEIIQKIKNAGIVGLGGAAFPTHVKLSPPPDKKIDCLVINGSECEPYLTVDDMLMQTHPKEIIEGIQIFLKVLNINKAYIGIEDNKKTAISILKNTINELQISESIIVSPLHTKYPQGAEKQLIYSILKRTVPSKSLPMDVGVVVQNVGTAFAVREAVLFNKPLYDRYITVSGSMINNPGNYKVRIGTKISDIIEECGGLKGDPAKIVIGGPMCGLSVHSYDIPVVKGTSGILFLSEKEAKLGDFSPCIRCGKCVAACPVGLLPCDLGNVVENDRVEMIEDLNPLDCVVCGSCSYCCPSNRPLTHFIKIAQQHLRDARSKKV